jgi:hypothetical protein
MFSVRIREGAPNLEAAGRTATPDQVVQACYGVRRTDDESRIPSKFTLSINKMVQRRRTRKSILLIYYAFIVLVITRLFRNQ